MITIADLWDDKRHRFRGVTLKGNQFKAQKRKRVRSGSGPGAIQFVWDGHLKDTELEAAQEYIDFLNGLTPESSQVPFHTSTARESELIARLEATGKVGTRTENLDTKPSEPRGKVEGFVYFIENARGNVKVGVAKNPLKRLRIFQTANDDNLELIGFIETEDMYGDEQKLHQKFRQARVRGEWFRVEDIEVPE